MRFLTGEEQYSGCFARLDRLQMLSWPSPGANPPPIPGFRVAGDTRVRPQSKIPTYGRVREFRSFTSKTKIWWQYRRLRGWLKPWRITIIADDPEGITPAIIGSVIEKCPYYRFILIEIAFDFAPASFVNRSFVRRYGVFGKSRRRKDRGGPGQLRYGSRKSGKLVRCYQKDEIDAFRVELEIHSRLIQQYAIENTHDLAALPYLMLPKHFEFVRIQWPRLQRYVERSFGPYAQGILTEARARSRFSLQSATRYLRQEGVRNTHRFLKPMVMNRLVERAVDGWSARFARAFHD